ncbi:hypothetical protein SAMN06273567_105168 [Geodermatophilus aquaeductus]|jgi:hypothetical protein|uniref:Uncharacterized protein n=1 Tax=Geodermatophilus aquaeductus TaxID=1564161 RepID=A0A521EKC4_9ACTN|nr:hypothetical protein SAMN06273567_105168 [Geodermatophilus aquaeductus]
MMHGQRGVRNRSAHGSGRTTPREERPGRGAVRGAGQPSCNSQRVPSGGAETVAENGWPCQGSSTASTPP